MKAHMLASTTRLPHVFAKHPHKTRGAVAVFKFVDSMGHVDEVPNFGTNAV
jgi:hypothetical protein